MTETLNKIDLISTIPKDTLQVIDNNFVGSVFFLQEETDFKIHQEDFDTKGKPLPDFFYNKPIVEPGKDPFKEENISVSRENSPRSGYLLLKKVENIRRSPNHLYESDNGIICAVNKNDQWETRYFSQQSLDPDFWNSITK